MPDFLSSEVPLVRGLSRKKIEQDTKLLLIRTLSFDPASCSAIDIEYFYEIVLPEIVPGLETGYADLSKFGISALGYTDASEFVSYVDKRLYEAAVEDPTSPEARRFRATVAHECGHCFYHIKQLKKFYSLSLNSESSLCRRKRRDIPAYLDPEW